MFHRHRHNKAAPVAATTGTVLPATGAALPTGVAAVPLATTAAVAAPAIVPVAPAPPGPILAVPMVPFQQQQVLPQPSGGGLLNKVKEVLPSTSTISSAVKKTAETVLPSSDVPAYTDATLTPVNAPVSMAPIAPPLPAQFTTLKEEPVSFLKEERPAVIKEKIINIEEESIQPVIHREVEKREIHEVLQPIHERQVLAPTFEEKQLQAEYRPVIGGYAPRQASVIAPSVEYANTERTQIVRPPIIEETIRKTIIEEVQPVIHREVVKPHIIRQTQPIYEKILEPEVILKETRPVIERAGEFQTFQTFQTQPAQLPAATSTFGNKYVFEVDQKTKLMPVGTTNVSDFNEQSQWSTVGYRGYPGAK